MFQSSRRLETRRMRFPWLKTPVLMKLLRKPQCANVTVTSRGAKSFPDSQCGKHGPIQISYIESSRCRNQLQVAPNTIPNLHLQKEEKKHNKTKKRKKKTAEDKRDSDHCCAKVCSTTLCAPSFNYSAVIRKDRSDAID